MRRLRIIESLPGCRTLLRLGVLVWLGLGASVGWGQPANDNFANAWTIVGASGTTNGSNVGATFETGEPDLFGLAAQESVWFTWTAPADGSYTFTTTGSDFDSLFGIYTGSAVNALTPVGQGYDVISASQSQPVTFTASAGTAYYVQVDGYALGIPDGNYVLNWNTNNGPSSAGDFLFASQATAPGTSMPMYIASERESNPPQDPRGKMHAAGEPSYGARLTITRLKGSTGRVLVDYVVTNGLYTNFFITNVFGTNMVATNTTAPNTFTNYFSTNIVVQERFENNEYGRWVYLDWYDITSIIGTNINGVMQVTKTNYSTNVPPAFACFNTPGPLPPPDTNGIIAYTNAFCIQTNITNIVASATPYADYTPTSGELTFDDFQMAQDIFVPVFASGNRSFPILNHVLIATITNVELDSLESTAIPPPTASTAATNAMLNILSTVAMVAPFQSNPETGPPGTGTGVAGTNVFNFERATLRCTETVNGTGVAYVGVTRSTVNASQGTTVNYRIDYYFPWTDENNTFMNANDWEIPLQPGSDYAGIVTRTPTGTYSDNIHFGDVSGTLSWGAYDTATKFIQIPITNESLVQFNEDLLVQLSLPGPTYPPADSDRSLGYVQTCNLTILFNDQPAGAHDNNYNPDNNDNTDPPYIQHPGPNSSVYAIALQPDGKAVIGGDFSSYNGIGVVNGQANIYRLARANTDGSLDQTFNTGNGADQAVNALTIDSSGNVVLGGAFTSFNGITRNRIARVTQTGALDPSFGLNQQGADFTVWALTIDPNSKNILVAGAFTNVNTFPRHYIARLLPDGTTDTSFDPGTGPDGAILAMALQPDGHIIIGGEFTHVDGALVNHIARLNSDGTLDSTFYPGGGFDNTVYSLALQPDGNIIVGGSFSTYNAYSCSGITRLDTYGNVDQSFMTGSGTDDAVYTVLLQPDGNILFGGIFKTYNQTRRIGIGRLYADGTLDTSFMDTGYNQFAGIPNHYWDPSVEGPNFISTMCLQQDGNILVGGYFPRVGGGSSRDDIHPKQNFTRLVGGSTPGPGNMMFAYPNYSANATDGKLFIEMFRTNGHLGPATVTVNPITYSTNQGLAGVAVPGQDFAFDAATYGTPTWLVSYPGITWHLSDGSFGQNNGFGPTVDPNTIWKYTQNDVWISVMDNTNVSGNKQLGLELDHPTDNDNFLLGGEKIPLGVALGRASAPMTIVDPHTLPGVIGFSSATYAALESTNAIITITRTNGSVGTVSAVFQTLNGTATNLLNYKSNWTRVVFNGGDTVKSVVVTNIHNGVKQGDRTVNLVLTAPTQGATLGLANAVLTIIDTDVTGGYVEFSSPTYSTNENAGTAYVTVNRRGSGTGTLSVQFSTSDGSATNGLNYIGSTNTLVWNNGDISPRVVGIPLLDDHVVETNDLTVNLQLSAATLNGTNDAAALTGTNTAVLAIVNSDSRGLLSFSTASYSVNENGGPGYITVVRSGGSDETVSANFATLPGTSTPGVDFYPTNGTFVFGPGEVSKTFTVPIIDNSVVDPARFITLVLSNVAPASAQGFPSTAILNIIDDETYNQPPGGLYASEDPSFGVNDAVYTMALQSDGKLLVGGDFTMAAGLERNRIARFNTDGSLDQSFSSTSPFAGVNSSVLTLISQTDGRVLIGGTFTNVNSTPRNYLARLALNGAVDTTFNSVSAGPNNPVYAAAETFAGSNRQLLIGGAFTAVNSSPCHFIARLNDDGTVDTAFQGNLNGNVYAIAVQADGKAIIGGDFTVIGTTSRPHVARLNTDGSLDITFEPGLGPNDSVRSIAVGLDGRVLIGGLFTNVAGANLNHIARLTSSGGVDGTFTPGLGMNDIVSTIAIQPDTRIVLGGQFTTCNGVTRHRLTRLNNDGTLDTQINFGDGADGFVASVVIETNGLIDFGGGFTHYDDQPVQNIARIYGGTVDGSGSLEFTSANYQVLETATNATLTVRRRGGTSGAVSNGVYIPNISVTFGTDPRGSTAVAGTNYVGLTNTLVFPPGEVFQSVIIPVLHDFAITPDLIVSNYIAKPMPAVAGGPLIGNQPYAFLTIINVDSGVSFSSPTYFFTEDSGYAVIPVLRTGSSNGVSSVDFQTTTNGTAIPFTNYIPVTTNIAFTDGQTSNTVQVPLLHYTAPQGNVTTMLQLSNAVGSLLLNPSQATLTIVDVDHPAGQLYFAATNYSVSEGAGALQVTVLRTNGSSGTVQVGFATVPGTALANLNYVPTNGLLTFGPGQTSQIFTVPIKQLAQYEGNTTFSLVLSNATGGATIVGPTNVPVTIIENNVGIGFVSPALVIPETSGNISLSVYRQNGTNGFTTVQYATTNLTAVAGVNYAPTNGILTFNPGDLFKSIVVGVIHDTNVTGDVSFGVNLSNPSAPAQLGSVPSETVVVLDVETGFTIAGTNLVTVTNADSSLSTNVSFGVVKSSGTNLLLTVLRSNVNTGVVGVNYATLDGTAQQGVDYVSTGGPLTFSNGIGSQIVSVQIISNRFVEGNRSFTLYLTNATPTNTAFLLSPYAATVTITDDVAGLSFSSAAYSATENSQQAAITVFRNNYTNSTVSVDFSTADGTGQANVNYVATNGTLVFNPGETSKSFAVGVIDDHIVDGGHTVLLSLGNPVGNAAIVNPANATLLVAETDGSLIVPAGVALTYESGPVNGVIDTNETVTVLFGLRNANGTNTTSLVATLLATNGVTNPSLPQNYGVLVAHGPSASRPFTFTAQGTNGQNITAVLQLRDGSTVLSNALFSFTLGQSPNTYTNGTYITINDDAKASPYPSAITVSNLNGLVAKATVVLTNLSHTSSHDIDVLLVSPTAQKSLLMAHCGGINGINNVTLTFDDTAANLLPQTTAITSGTYRPTSYDLAPPPFPPASAPYPTNATAPPYVTNLSVFNGTTPNGTWALYVYDDEAPYSGSIANGWMLNLVMTGPVQSAADLGLAMTASAASVVATSNLTYTVTVTNYGPAGATNVVVTDTLPAGAVLTATNATQGGISSSAGLITWNAGSLAYGAAASLTIGIQPSGVGTITNTATVASTSLDPNPDDDSAFVTTTIIYPTADLAVSMVDSPDPVMVGFPLTYTLTVTNLGPATAPGVTLVDTLPPSVSFVSASPGSNYTVVGRVVTFSNLGNVGSNQQVTAQIVVVPTAPGTVLNSANGSSGVTDPYKPNNNASAKTVVQAVPLTFSHTGGGLSISWPASANYILESTTNLNPPTVWSPYTEVAPSVVTGTATVVVPIEPGKRYFRLLWTATPVLPLSLTRSGSNLIFAWPVNPYNASLESTTNLHPPVVWSPVTSPLPHVAGGQNTLTMPVGAGRSFFRLHGTTP